MQWINDFAKLNGYTEDIFTDLDDYQQCSDDYEYYERKSKTQYKKDE